jgi:hypothetical protein
MTMTSDSLAGTALRGPNSARGTSHLHVYEHGDVSIELDVTERGDFARIIGVVIDASGAGLTGAHVSLETASTSRTVDLDDDRFTFERVPLGLARIVLERDGQRVMSTTWFDVG